MRKKSCRFPLVFYRALLAFNRSKQATLSKHPPCSTSDLCGSSTCQGRSGSHPSGAEVLHTESPQLHARSKWNNVGNPMMNLPSGAGLYTAFLLILEINDYYWVSFGNEGKQKQHGVSYPGPGLRSKRSQSACAKKGSTSRVVEYVRVCSEITMCVSSRWLWVT